MTTPELSPTYRERVAWLERVTGLQRSTLQRPPPLPARPPCFCGAGKVGDKSKIEGGDVLEHEAAHCLHVRTY